MLFKTGAAFFFPIVLNMSRSTHVRCSAADLWRQSEAAFALQEEQQRRGRRSKRCGAASSPPNSLLSLLHVSLRRLHCKGRAVWMQHESNTHTCTLQRGQPWWKSSPEHGLDTWPARSCWLLHPSGRRKCQREYFMWREERQTFHSDWPVQHRRAKPQ